MIRDTRGFTLIEMAATLAITALLLTLVFQCFGRLKIQAEAAHIVGDFRAVASGVYAKMAVDGDLPRSRDWSTVPSDLLDYLPPDFEFSYGDAQYRWRVWNSRQSRRTGYRAALQIRSGRRRLVQSLVGTYNGRMAILRGNQVTLIVM